MRKTALFMLFTLLLASGCSQSPNAADPNPATLVPVAGGATHFAVKIEPAALHTAPQASAKPSSPAPATNKPAKPMVHVSKGEVALTFDDGPTKHTEELLSILKKYEVKATFFDIGEGVADYPKAVKETLKQGHVLGTHTQSHANLKKKDGAGQQKEIEGGVKAIQKVTGEKPILFRPPYGNFNDVTKAAAGQLGQRMILWSVDPRDWDTKDPNVVVKRVLADVKGGDIVLLHDRPSTIKALPRIIEGIHKKGMTFVTIPNR